MFTSLLLTKSLLPFPHSIYCVWQCNGNADCTFMVATCTDLSVRAYQDSGYFLDERITNHQEHKDSIEYIKIEVDSSTLITIWIMIAIVAIVIVTLLVYDKC